MGILSLISSFTMTRILGILCIVFFIVMYIELQIIHIVGEKNASLHAEMESLEQQSKRQAQVFEQSRKQAIDDMRQANKESTQIMLANVPTNCDDAITWGINEAHNFS